MRAQSVPKPLLSFLLLVGIFIPNNTFGVTPEIIYDNTSTPMLDARFTPPRQRYVNQNLEEIADQLQLSGTARMITDIYFEYYGNFTAQGDETARVRIYNNSKVYDNYRKSPTDTLYESGFFRIYQGYHVEHLQNLNLPVPDIISFGISFGGLAQNEDAGFLLYSPPSVGASFNELWRRKPASDWEVITFNLSDPTYKANAGIRIVAVVQPVELQVQIVNNQVQLNWTAPGSNFQVEKTTSLGAAFQSVGTTTQKSWSEPFNKSSGATYYRVKQL